MKMSTCHPNKASSTRDGLCAACHAREDRAQNPEKYRLARIKRLELAPRAICHPDRPSKTNGQCESCYMKHLGERNPGFRARQLAGVRARHKRKRDNSPESVSRASRATGLRWRYGLEIEDYDQMYINQGGRCGICGSEEPGGSKKHFVVDHSHLDGHIRGLLCFRCNRDISVFDRGHEHMLLVTSYLGKK